jgi:hypothetical protein
LAEKIMLKERGSWILPNMNNGSGTGGSGPRKACSRIILERNLDFDYRKITEFVDGLDRVLESLKKYLDDESERLQGHSLNFADIEHMLCKVEREKKLR